MTTTTTPGSATDGRVIADGDTRKRVYDLLAAIGALLVGVGLLGPDELQLWLAVAGAALPIAGLLVARLNVPRKGRHAEPAT